ncbi:cupin domain-containing protein [Paenibacillus sinensis]|nr:cupin domain-containing protein [Paenibacillus sinensis]
MDFTSPDVRFFYDLRQNPFFIKDERNFINSLSVNELNTLGNASMLDIFLSKQNVVEPHIHQNATELVYCVSGCAVVSLINPFTKKLINCTVAPCQVACIPQGWWHYEIATTDNTHLIAIFDAPIPELITGSDILRLTPAEVLSHTYCLNEEQIRAALAPIKDTVIIGPPKGCVEGCPPPMHAQQSVQPIPTPFPYAAPAGAVMPAAVQPYGCPGGYGMSGYAPGVSSIPSQTGGMYPGI